jgi:hypothetical protein
MRDADSAGGEAVRALHLTGVRGSRNKKEPSTFDLAEMGRNIFAPLQAENKCRLAWWWLLFVAVRCQMGAQTIE